MASISLLPEYILGEPCQDQLPIKGPYEECLVKFTLTESEKVHLIATTTFKVADQSHTFVSQEDLLKYNGQPVASPNFDKKRFIQEFSSENKFRLCIVTFSSKDQRSPQISVFRKL